MLNFCDFIKIFVFTTNHHLHRECMYEFTLTGRGWDDNRSYHSRPCRAQIVQPYILFFFSPDDMRRFNLQRYLIGINKNTGVPNL